jgi:hypothetical protein
LQIDYEKTIADAERDGVDFDYVDEHHSFSQVAERFNPYFLKWFKYMESSVFLQAGGYPFHRDDFTEAEWQAMGLIANFHKAKQYGND